MSSIRRGAAVVQRYLLFCRARPVRNEGRLHHRQREKPGRTPWLRFHLDRLRRRPPFGRDAGCVAEPARTESRSVHRVVPARRAAGGPCHLGLPSQVRRDVPPRKRSRPAWSLRRTRSSRLGRSTNKKDRARSSSRGGTSLEADGLAADNDRSSEVARLRKLRRRRLPPFARAPKLLPGGEPAMFKKLGNLAPLTGVVFFALLLTNFLLNNGSPSPTSVVPTCSPSTPTTTTE